MPQHQEHFQDIEQPKEELDDVGNKDVTQHICSELTVRSELVGRP
jgi:hypothetical protein